MVLTQQEKEQIVKEIYSWTFSKKNIFSRVMDKLPSKYRKKGNVYRGLILTHDQYDKLKRGGFKTNKTSSWSRDINVAKTFATEIYGDEHKFGAILKTKLPSSHFIDIFSIYNSDEFRDALLSLSRKKDISTVNLFDLDKEILITKPIKVPFKNAVKVFKLGKTVKEMKKVTSTSTSNISDLIQYVKKLGKFRSTKRKFVLQGKKSETVKGVRYYTMRKTRNQMAAFVIIPELVFPSDAERFSVQFQNKKIKNFDDFNKAFAYYVGLK